MDLFYKILAISFVYMLAGAFAFKRLNRHSDKTVSRQRNMKLVTYIFMVLILYVSILFVPVLMYLISAFLIFVALREILNAADQTHRSPILPLIIGASILFAFALFIKDSQPDLILFAYFTVVIFDGFSQVTGELLGKRKMLPRISPSKTWEGFLGGAAASIVAGFLVFGMTSPEKTFSEIILIILSALAGDVLASWYKRQCRIKDFSNLLPGHGGVLDRFDSFFMAGAVLATLQLFYSQ